MVVDDTATFRRIITGGYTCITQLENDVKRFQTETATCFYRCTAITAAAHKRKCGEELPSGCAYKFIQYRCVHSKRSNCNGKRYRCYNCKARFSVILKGRFYEIGRYSLVHSHDFHLGNPWIYAPNRRLTSEQESAIRTLMSTFRNTKELQRLIASQYGLQVNRFDLLNIRRRPRNEHCDEVIEVMPSTPHFFAHRQQADERDVKVHEFRDGVTDITTQHCGYGTQNVRTEIVKVAQPVPQHPVQRRYVNEQSAIAEKPQVAPVSTAATQLCGYGAQMVRTEVADLTHPLPHDPAQEQQGNERATKVHESQEVLADIATHLCSYDTQNFRNMLDALKTLRNVMSMESDITLYCSTPKCSIPLPLNSLTDLKKLKGVHYSGSTSNPSLNDSERFMSESVSATHFDLQSGCSESEGSSCLTNSTNGVSSRSNKRKAPLTLRIT